MILSSVQYFQIDNFRMKFVPYVFVHEMIAKRSVCCSVNRVASVFVVPQADWAHGLPYIKCIPPLLLTYPTHGSLETFGGPQRHVIAHLKAGKMVIPNMPSVMLGKSVLF